MADTLLLVAMLSDLVMGDYGCSASEDESPLATCLLHGGASITEVPDDSDKDIMPSDKSYLATNRSTNADPLLYKYVEVSRTSPGYEFTQVGGKALPGLISSHFPASERAEAQQRQLFTHTVALTIRQSQPRCDAPIAKLFPNVRTIVRNCSIPVPMEVPTLVDKFVITKDAVLGISLFQPEVQTLGADFCPSTAKRVGVNKLGKHVINIGYFAGHPLLASADIEVSLPVESVHELVFIFTKVECCTPSVPIRPSSQPCGMLNGVVKAMASSIAERYTLVGADDIPRAAVNLKRKQTRKPKILREVKKIMEEHDDRQPADFIEFVSLTEYKARVGEFQYYVETGCE